MKEKDDDGVLQLNLSDEFILDSAESRYDNGDYLGALTMLNKRSGMYEPSADACALYADVYEAMELYNLAADAWFRFLDTCNEADFGEGYEGLAVAFMNMNNEAQSAYYYRRSLSEEDVQAFDIEFSEPEPRKPKLRLVHSDDGTHGNPEALREGLALLKQGELEEARSVLGEFPEAHPDYASAAGLAAMCTLVLEKYPDNVQALTTYCAVLGARENREGAKAVAKQLASLKASGTDDLYRIATALCETGLDEEAYEKLTVLKSRLPYDDNVLYFHAVSAYRTGRTAEAIESLERLTTIYPRKAVALYYLERLRTQEGDDKAEKVSMSYFYRVPEEEYETVAKFLLGASNSPYVEELEGLSRLDELFGIAFDEMEGRDEKLQMLAAKVAVRTRSDSFLRKVLLDFEGDEFIKIAILHDLTMRNEDDSFGVVFCNVYKEFFTHSLDIGERKKEEYLKAFADVYSKFALLGEENEGKICAAAEDIYATIEELDAWHFVEERASLAAAIYREARLLRGERALEEIVKMFDANRETVEKILSLMM